MVERKEKKCNPPFLPAPGGYHEDYNVMVFKMRADKKGYGLPSISSARWAGI